MLTPCLYLYQEAGRATASRIRERAQTTAGPETQRAKSQRKGTAAPHALSTPRVSVWLTPRERSQVGAAIGGCAAITSRDTLDAVRRDISENNADAALVSVALVRRAHVPALSVLAESLPWGAVVGLVLDTDEAQALAGTLCLGRAGIGHLVDVRAPSGWPLLRRAFTAHHLPDAFMRAALAAVEVELGTVPSFAQVSEGRELGERIADARSEHHGPPARCLDFFRLVFSPEVQSAKQLANALGVLPMTLMSRFFRAGLPSPKRYLMFARLAWAAHLAESPALTVGAIAHRLDASSSQSFGRTVRFAMGMTAVQFRRAFTGRAMLDRFIGSLVHPYRDTLRAFDPASATSSRATVSHDALTDARPDASSQSTEPEQGRQRQPTRPYEERAA